jgi:hypothetical protein
MQLEDDAADLAVQDGVRRLRVQHVVSTALVAAVLVEAAWLRCMNSV